MRAEINQCSRYKQHGSDVTSPTRGDPMRKILGLSLLSLGITIGAAFFAAHDAYAAKEGYCNGGGCCDYANPSPGATCTLESFSCYRSGYYCIEDCEYHCIPN